jgi:biotin operon repressor
MPRRPRQDIYPIIRMRDTSSVKKQLRDAVNPRFGIVVYSRGKYEKRYQVLDEFSQYCLRMIKDDGIYIDHDVVHYIAHRMELAEAYPTSPDAGDGADEVEHKLCKCGSRAYVTQNEIANDLGKSVASIGRAIKQLKQTNIIVNFGKGWYELNADFFWRGPEDIRRAYCKVQPSHPSLKIQLYSSGYTKYYEM